MRNYTCWPTAWSKLTLLFILLGWKRAAHFPGACSQPRSCRPLQWGWGALAGPLTLSSCESGWSRLCCWMAMGGGRGTASAPSSPSSSPQLCMPDDEDFESVPLLRPSFRPLWNQTNVCSLYSRPDCQGQITERSPKGLLGKYSWDRMERTEIRSKLFPPPMVTVHSLPATRLPCRPTWMTEGPLRVSSEGASANITC